VEESAETAYSLLWLEPGLGLETISQPERQFNGDMLANLLPDVGATATGAGIPSEEPRAAASLDWYADAPFEVESAANTNILISAGTASMTAVLDDNIFSPG
jgi:hypothetical protein